MCVSFCFTDSFWTNPQYRVKISGESFEKDAEKNMLVSLMQKPDKRNRRLVQNLHIGFSIYEVNIGLYCFCHTMWTIMDVPRFTAQAVFIIGGQFDSQLAVIHRHPTEQINTTKKVT